MNIVAFKELIKQIGTNDQIFKENRAVLWLLWSFVWRNTASNCKLKTSMPESHNVSDDVKAMNSVQGVD